MIGKRIVLIVAPVAAAVVITFGGVTAASADPGDITARPPGQVETGTASPALVRWLRAVAVCSEMYPPGTDISNCIRHLY